jgi:hypothetical protein
VFFLNTGTFLPLLIVNGSALHGDRCIAGREAYTNFNGEAVCLMADNVWNEGKLLAFWAD